MCLVLSPKIVFEVKWQAAKNRNNNIFRPIFGHLISLVLVFLCYKKAQWIIVGLVCFMAVFLHPRDGPNGRSSFYNDTGSRDFHIFLQTVCVSVYVWHWIPPPTCINYQTDYCCAANIDVNSRDQATCEATHVCPLGISPSSDTVTLVSGQSPDPQAALL